MGAADRAPQPAVVTGDHAVAVARQAWEPRGHLGILTPRPAGEGGSWGEPLPPAVMDRGLPGKFKSNNVGFLNLKL